MGDVRTSPGESDLREAGTSGLIDRLVPAWDRLRTSPERKGLFLYLLALGLLLAASQFPDRERSPAAAAERLAFDAQMRLLRALHPRPLADDVVLIGTDDETYRAFDEPFALWHKHLAAVMHALAKAKPRAVGVDFVLPERSFERNLPGGDFAMMTGLVNLKRATNLVYVQTVDGQGRIVPIQQNYRGILGEGNLGLDQHLRDPDGVSRRFGEFSNRDGTPLPTLVGRIATAIGLAPREGYIDYSLGVPVKHVPLHRVAAMDEASLQSLFGGRVVLMGSLVGFVDRWQLPVLLLEQDPSRPLNDRSAGAYTQPGVLIHLQALRSVLGPGMLVPMPPAVQWAMALAALLAVLLHVRPAAMVAIALLAPVALLGASLASITLAQALLPLAFALAALWLALLSRAVFDASEAVVERVRLRRTFAGQVSPAVMQEMLAGGLTPGVNGQLAEVCVLFSDVRDFTTLSEKMSPTVVTAVLQRYFDRMVKAVHRYDGTVDKFIGDGMMVLFGAPRKSKDPCGDAVRCALAMMEALDALNEEFRAESLPILTIGIGINYGVVTVGNIGSSERHNYSAIGDAVNVAARLEGLTKVLGRKILITDAVVKRLTDQFQFEALGSHSVKGHSPVNIWGIRTSRAASEAA